MTRALACSGPIDDQRIGKIRDAVRHPERFYQRWPCSKNATKAESIGHLLQSDPETNMTETEKSVKQKPPAQPIRPIKAVAAPRGSHAKTINHHFPTSNARLSLERWQ
jgi:hypothetical protein